MNNNNNNNPLVSFILESVESFTYWHDSNLSFDFNDSLPNGPFCGQKEFVCVLFSFKQSGIFCKFRDEQIFCKAKASHVG
jgi:hypothetical protein